MKTLLTFALLGLTLLLGGCGTVAGIGQDIQRGGQVLQDAARR